MLVYLDTNVFDNLIKEENGCTRADEQHLRAVVRTGNITRGPATGDELKSGRAAVRGFARVRLKNLQA